MAQTLQAAQKALEAAKKRGVQSDIAAAQRLVDYWKGQAPPTPTPTPTPTVTPKLTAAQKALKIAKQKAAAGTIPQSDVAAAERLVAFHQKKVTPTITPTVTKLTLEEAKSILGRDLTADEISGIQRGVITKDFLLERKRQRIAKGEEYPTKGLPTIGDKVVEEKEEKPFDWEAFLEEQQEVAATSEEARRKEREEYKEELKEELGVGEMPPKPPPADFESDYEALRSEKGMEAIETQINDLSALMRDTEAALRAGLYDEEGKLRPMELISTRQRELTRQAQEAMDTYTRRKAALVDEYNVKANVINTMMNLKKADYAAAVDSYNADFNRAIKIIDMVEDYETKEIAMDNQEKTNAQANLSVIEKIMSETNQTWEDIDPMMQTQIATLEMKAGLPSGTFELLMASVDTTKNVEQTTYSKDKSQVHVRYDDGTFELFDTGIAPEVEEVVEEKETEKRFWSAIDRGKNELQQGEPWGNVWNRIKMEFPDVPDDVIDRALGISWREPGAYEKFKKGEPVEQFITPDYIKSKFSVSQIEDIDAFQPYKKKLKTRATEYENFLKDIMTDVEAWRIAGHDDQTIWANIVKQFTK